MSFCMVLFDNIWFGKPVFEQGNYCGASENKLYLYLSPLACSCYLSGTDHVPAPVWKFKVQWFSGPPITHALGLVTRLRTPSNGQSLMWFKGGLPFTGLRLLEEWSLWSKGESDKALWRHEHSLLLFASFSLMFILCLWHFIRIHCPVIKTRLDILCILAYPRPWY